MRRRPPSSVREGKGFLFLSFCVCTPLDSHLVSPLSQLTVFARAQAPPRQARRRAASRRRRGVSEQQGVGVPVFVGQQDGGHRAAGALEGVPGGWGGGGEGWPRDGWSGGRRPSPPSRRALTFATHAQTHFPTLTWPAALPAAPPPTGRAGGRGRAWSQTRRMTAATPSTRAGRRWPWCVEVGECLSLSDTSSPHTKRDERGVRCFDAPQSVGVHRDGSVFGPRLFNPSHTRHATPLFPPTLSVHAQRPDSSRHARRHGEREERRWQGRERRAHRVGVADILETPPRVLAPPPPARGSGPACRAHTWAPAQCTLLGWKLGRPDGALAAWPRGSPPPPPAHNSPQFT